MFSNYIIFIETILLIFFVCERSWTNVPESNVSESTKITETYSKHLLHTSTSPSTSPNRTVDIYIRTYSGDADWLTLCLRSIELYGQIIRQVNIVWPETEDSFFRSFIFPESYNLRLNLRKEQEILSIGYAEQMLSKLFADQATDADYILHMDSDNLLTATLQDSDLFYEDKPISYWASWEECYPTHELRWRQPTIKALGLNDSLHSFMVGYPEIYPRHIYQKVRDHIEKVHQMSIEEYYKREVCTSESLDWQEQTFPTEFELLGGYLFNFENETMSFLYHEKNQTGPILKNRSWSGFTPAKVAYYECLLRRPGTSTTCKIDENLCTVVEGAGCKKPSSCKNQFLQIQS